MLKNNGKVIMWDMDGVLADFTEGFTSLARTLFDVPIVRTIERIRWDDMAGLGLTKSGVDKVWDKIKHSGGFWENLKPIITKEEITTVNELWDDLGWDMYFVTNRVGLNAKDQTENWLAKYGFATGSVIVSGRKGEAARVLDADFMIDDKAGNCVYSSYESPKTKTFIVDRLYNQFNPDVLGSKVVRVKTVSEFLQYVKEAS